MGITTYKGSSIRLTADLSSIAEGTKMTYLEWLNKTISKLKFKINEKLWHSQERQNLREFIASRPAWQHTYRKGHLSTAKYIYFSRTRRIFYKFITYKANKKILRNIKIWKSYKICSLAAINWNYKLTTNEYLVTSKIHENSRTNF